MQGLQNFVETSEKIAYVKQLMRVGFHRLDCGSFVSAKAIPQMQDSRLVMEALAADPNVQQSPTKCMCIVGNEQGAKEAALCERVDYLGFPLSVSETFQQRNLRKSIARSFEVLLRIRDIAHCHQQQVLVYLSMAFGNPYGEPYDVAVVMEHLERLRRQDFLDVALADTTGEADATSIGWLYRRIYRAFPSLSLGLHLHTTHQEALGKIAAAHQAGCLYFDTVIRGYGGCPMAQDKLVGNLPTESIITYLKEKSLTPPLCETAWRKAVQYADKIFSRP